MTPAPGNRARSGWAAAAPLRHIRAYRRLVGGQMAGQLADGLVQIAFAQIILFEAGRGATPWEITKLLVVTLLPYSVAGPIAGVVIGPATNGGACWSASRCSGPARSGDGIGEPVPSRVTVRLIGG